MNALVFRFRGADSISGGRTDKIPSPSGRGRRREGRRVRALGMVNSRSAIKSRTKAQAACPILETTTAIKRAGADIIITYYALELAKML